MASTRTCVQCDVMRGRTCPSSVHAGESVDPLLYRFDNSVERRRKMGCAVDWGMFKPQYRAARDWSMYKADPHLLEPKSPQDRAAGANDAPSVAAAGVGI